MEEQEQSVTIEEFLKLDYSQVSLVDLWEPDEVLVKALTQLEQAITRCDV